MIFQYKCKKLIIYYLYNSNYLMNIKFNLLKTLIDKLNKYYFILFKNIYLIKYIIIILRV